MSSLLFEEQNNRLIEKVSQYPSLLNFWKHKYSIDNLILPQNYSIIEDILDFQNGYAYNSVENKSLIGSKEGDFKENWLVIATNYFADPFLINFDEVSENFPVYFTFHGTGKWILIKVAHSILVFQEILNTIFEYQSFKNKFLIYLNKLKKEGNIFWEEVYQNELNSSEIIEEKEEINESDWQEVEIYITDIGFNKMKIISLLREKHNLTGAEALKLSKSNRIFYGKGKFKFMKTSMQQLKNFGVSFDVVKL